MFFSWLDQGDGLYHPVKTPQLRALLTLLCPVSCVTLLTTVDINLYPPAERLGQDLHCKVTLSPFTLSASEGSPSAQPTLKSRELLPCPEGRETIYVIWNSPVQKSSLFSPTCIYSIIYLHL